jgi:hypothetical protein
MTERNLQRWPDEALIEAVRLLEREVDWPDATAAGGRDLATAVRLRIESTPSPALPGRRWSISGPRWANGPVRRALLIAAGLLLLLAAIAGAAGVGVPGLRVLFGGGSVSPPPSLEPDRSPSPGGPGAGMRLGDPLSPSDRALLDARAGFEVRWPADPLAGPPDAAYVDETKHGQVSLVWATRADLPATLEPGVGLLMTEFLGTVDDAYYGKAVGSGTTVEPVLVGGQRGYWLSGEPHFFFYTGPGGVVQDERRWVGDALIWSDGTVTYRLESALGREATIRIATTVR